MYDHEELKRRNAVAICKNGTWRKPVWFWRTWAVMPQTGFFGAIRDTWITQRGLKKFRKRMKRKGSLG